MNFNRFIVNTKSVVTEDVYFATETGKILEVNLNKDCFFRESTLYSLLVKAPQPYSRINRVRQMAGKHEERHLIKPGKGGDMLVQPKRPLQMDDELPPEDRENVGTLQKRGTMNFVRNVIVQRMQMAVNVKKNMHDVFAS